jgi:hypothetical protein
LRFVLTALSCELKLTTTEPMAPNYRYLNKGRRLTILSKAAIGEPLRRPLDTPSPRFRNLTMVLTYVTLDEVELINKG